VLFTVSQYKLLSVECLGTLTAGAAHPTEEYTAVAGVIFRRMFLFLKGKRYASDLLPRGDGERDALSFGCVYEREDLRKMLDVSVQYAHPFLSW
jgi:hypothetical protein